MLSEIAAAAHTAPKMSHPSLLPSWIAAVAGSVATIIATSAGWVVRRSNAAQTEMLTHMTDNYLKGTELLLQQQQKQFEQFIRDYFRSGVTR
jgi:uncharacterized protein YbcV (DUF1398 family)